MKHDQSVYFCSCGDVLAKSQDATGGYRIRGKITIIRGNQVFTVCKSCDKEMQLPIEVDITVKNPKLFIKK